jgi:putative membrane protein
MIANYTDHAANERTFLAWVRTAIAVVGFGLAAARLDDIATTLWSELLLLASGGLVIVVAYLRMMSVRRRIVSVDRQDDEPLPADTLLVLLIVALMLMLAMFAIHVS